jgi:hypothetical protein
MSIGTVNFNTWKIWFQYYKDGEPTGAGVLIWQYAHKSSAVRRAKQQFGNNPNVEWHVSQTNPFD